MIIISKGRQAVIAAVALCLVAVVFAVSYGVLRPAAVTGSKSIEVEIAHSPGESKSVKIKTDAEYLRQALEEQNLIQGEESQYGLFVKTVDGVTVDDGRQEWWRFTKNGEQLMTGVDMTPIADGEHYEITLVSGY